METSLSILEIKPGTEQNYFHVGFIGRFKKEELEILISLSESGIIKLKI